MRPFLLFLPLLFAGCAAPVSTLAVPPEEPGVFSLFSGDGSGLDEATIARLLDSRVEVPKDARIAVLQAPSRSRYPTYYVTERDVSTREAHIDTLGARLVPVGVREIESIPSLLVPEQPSVPVLREIAVRLQADALLLYRVNGDLYQNVRLFRSDQFKAYATCEAILLDVRTGAIPFTTVVTRECLTQSQDSDLTTSDARRRAEQQAILLALSEMGREVATFLSQQ